MEVTPQEKRAAIVELACAIADAKCSGNKKLISWAIQCADKELCEIIPDIKKPSLEDFKQ